jgi:DNA-binding PucR family transcriptional regulator
VVPIDANTPAGCAVARVPLALQETTISRGRGTLVGAVSSVVRGAEGLAAPYDGAQQVLRCLIELGDASTVALSASELGVGGLLLGTCDKPTVERFIRATVEPLLRNPARAGDLLATLEAFMCTGRSAREAASRLDVHE